MPLDSTFRPQTLSPSIAEEEKELRYLDFVEEIRGYATQFTKNHVEFLSWFSRRMDELVAEGGGPEATTVTPREAKRWLRAFKIILDHDLRLRGRYCKG